jgi:hypothetical protein
MQLLPISGSPQVTSISSAVRNVCNATLSLLFTISLFVWGFLVNRQQAWRTDGGTAVFGVAALVLAVVSTALNFLYVHKEDEFVWLPTLVWAVVLWQSFFGWWWWVGAGSGGGLTGKDDEMEEKLQRRAKRETRRKAAEERSQKRKLMAQQVWQGVASALSRETSPPRRRRRRPSSSHTLVDEEVEMSSLDRNHRSTSFETSGRIPSYMPNIAFRWYKSLRRAHIDAARLQAEETAERMRGIGQDRMRDEEGSGDRVLSESEGAPKSNSFWWWGPLGRWRLQDSTTYS